MEYLQFLEPWMIPIVIMICVTLIVMISSVTKIITTSMNKREGKSLAENKEFLNALREFKETMDRRVSNLEKIAASEEPVTSSDRQVKRKQNQRSIELEFDDEPAREKEIDQSPKLKNMLNL